MPNGSLSRVFLSYTSELATHPTDLSYVSAAADVLTGLGCLPVHMQHFGARDTPPATACVDEVAGCDAWVGLIGFRYGSIVPDRAQLSYTELEFDAATAAGLPRFAFLVDPGSIGLPPSAIVDRRHGQRQDAFRTRLENTDITIQRFQSADQLARLIAQLVRAQPSPVKVTLAEHRVELERELDLLRLAVRNHGWTIRSDSPSAIRIEGRDGRRYSLPLGQADTTRLVLRDLVNEMHAAGLRVNTSLLVPPGERPRSPFQHDPPA